MGPTNRRCLTCESLRRSINHLARQYGAHSAQYLRCASPGMSLVCRMASRPNTGSDTASQTRRVLVIDDDASFAETLAALLTQDGFDVRLAFGAAEGFELLEHFIPDIA